MRFFRTSKDSSSRRDSGRNGSGRFLTPVHALNKVRANERPVRDNTLDRIHALERQGSTWLNSVLKTNAGAFAGAGMPITLLFTVLG